MLSKFKPRPTASKIQLWDGKQHFPLPFALSLMDDILQHTWVLGTASGNLAPGTNQHKAQSVSGHPGNELKFDWHSTNKPQLVTLIDLLRHLNVVRVSCSYTSENTDTVWGLNNTSLLYHISMAQSPTETTTTNVSGIGAIVFKILAIGMCINCNK